MPKNQFAELLKYYLALNHKTQADMVKDMNIDKSTISCWCNGSRVPKLDTIIDIANYLNVEPGDLIIKTDENSAPEPNTLAAHFEGEEFTDEELEEIANFVKFVKAKRNN